VALALAPLTVVAAPRAATVKATAWVSTKTPAQNTNVIAFTRVTIDGKWKSGIKATFTFQFKTRNKTCTATTDKRGIAWCRMNIGTAAPNTKVIVQVTTTVEGETYTALTSFTPTEPTETGAGTATAPPLPTPAATPTKRPPP
jgi:hypothetical protein